MDNIDSIFIDNAQRAEIDDFENLASSENLELQYAALYALRKLADPETTSFLIKELDATDSLSQYTALATLAEMYKKGGDYGPGLGPFLQDKEKYIRVWKKWSQDQTPSIVVMPRLVPASSLVHAAKIKRLPLQRERQKTSAKTQTQTH